MPGRRNDALWFQSLMLATTSAQTIAMRTWLLWPRQGRLTPWQRREASNMVLEKLAALHEAQTHAALLMWRSALLPWTVAAPGSTAALNPWLSRTRSNSRRLARRLFVRD